jgi:transposase InsO family protein
MSLVASAACAGSAFASLADGSATGCYSAGPNLDAGWRGGVGDITRFERPGQLVAYLGLEPALRYERERPGELIHVDVKKLGRIQGGAGKRVTGKPRHNWERSDRSGTRRKMVGWEFVHIAIDDCTRLAYAEVLANEKASTVVAFLHRAVAFFKRHGMNVQQLLTDNGGAYRSGVHAIACRMLGIRHLRTRPYRPQTNGKAERLIRTMLGGWAYGAIYHNSTERTAALDGWLFYYNHHRKHSALGHKPPITRLWTSPGFEDT